MATARTQPTPRPTARPASAQSSQKAVAQLILALFIAGLLGLGVSAGLFIVAKSFISSTRNQVQAKNEELSKLQKEFETLKQQAQQQADTAKTVATVVAASPITAGQEVTADLLKLEQRPLAEEVPGVFHRLEDVVSQRASQAIAAGDPLSLSNVGLTGAGNNTAMMQVLPGYRAMAIKIDRIGSVAGEIKAGSFVDVLSTLSPNENVTVAKTLLQRVQVIGVNLQASDDTASVTLAVHPSEAEALALANEKGKFHLTLRGPEDGGVSALSGRSLAQLSGVGSPASSPVVSKPSSTTNSGLPPQTLPRTNLNTYTMEIVKGANSERVSLSR